MGPLAEVAKETFDYEMICKDIAVDARKTALNLAGSRHKLV